MVLHPGPGTAADRSVVSRRRGHQGAVRPNADPCGSRGEFVVLTRHGSTITGGIKTGAGIGQQAFGSPIPQSLEEVCGPARTALIVYDMQVGVVSQLSDGGVITQRVAEVRRAARDAGVRVVYTRHMSLPNEVAGIIQL